MKIIICGSRDWVRYELIDNTVFRLKQILADDLTIIEGEARGVDSMARISAKKYGIKVQQFPAKWTVFGKAAGPIRNREMLDQGPDMVIAFSNDIAESRGTKNMVNLALDAKVPCFLLTEDNYKDKISGLASLIQGIRNAEKYHVAHPEEYCTGDV